MTYHFIYLLQGKKGTPNICIAKQCFFHFSLEVIDLVLFMLNEATCRLMPSSPSQSASNEEVHAYFNEVISVLFSNLSLNLKGLHLSI